ncbi:hypothetical protein EMO92_07965 [Bifidobacterium reuteri]|uniref:Uncharacterized protein n=1 Tax=Bifidobacterium reuteri TaxID=983706 RepID=A0A5J5E7J9_9BIFI|nr:hypothetical protein [Bifidobacterium reuteri]KAA8824842.1 hypothetical protein EMO92_07965 [Bifidobacterium reuteri]
MSSGSNEAFRIAAELIALQEDIVGLQNRVSDVIGNTATLKDTQIVQKLGAASVELGLTVCLLQQIRI